MARRSSIDSLRRFWRVLLVPLPFIIALPFLVKPSFSLVDDGVSLDIAKRMDANEMREEKLADGTVETPSPRWYIEKRFGRVRPTYWWWMWLNYKVWGTSAAGWHIGLVAALVVLLQIVYEISYRTTRSVLAGMLAAGLIVAFHPYASVFTRLGLGETPMLLLLGVSVLCMVWILKLAPRVRFEEPSGVVAFACLCVGALAPLFSAYFMKETSLAMVPASLVMVFALWRWRSGPLSWAALLVYAAANVACAVVLLVHVAPLLGAGSYAKQYFFRGYPEWGTGQRLGTSVTMLLDYLGVVGKAWSALPILALGTLGFRLVRGMRGKGAVDEAAVQSEQRKQRRSPAKAPAPSGGVGDDVRWQLVWLTCAAASVVLVAPWGGSSEVVARYLLPVTMLGALLIGGELAWLLTGAWAGLGELGKTPDRFGAPRDTLRAVVVAVAVLLCALGAMNLVLAVRSTAETHRRQTADANLLRLIAAEAPEGQPVFAMLVAKEEEEARYEMTLHLRLLYGREDFTFRSIRYLADPDEPAVPEEFKAVTGIPGRGDWAVFPWGRYRRELYGELKAGFELLEPTRMYAVTPKGWTREMDLDTVVLKTMPKAGYGWIVLVSGRDLEPLEPAEGVTP